MAAWSSQMAPDFKKMMLEKWAIAFGKPELVNIMQIFDERIMYADKLGHTDSWGNIGVDIEGFNGKLNTDGHIDIMAYLVYKMRSAGIIEEPANFMCLIDDGLMEVCVPREDFNERVEKIVKLIDQGYPAFGHDVSWDKTYYSGVFSMYLNEITLDGQRLTPGVKSFLKVGVPQDVPIANLMDELISHASTTRGAIKVGTNHNLAYDAYVGEYYLSLKRWSGYADLDTRDCALRSFLPFSLSGYSLNSQMSLSTNTTFDTFETATTNCFLISRCFPDLMNWYANVFNRSPEEMDPGIILRNPKSLAFDLSRLSNRKFANVVRAKILKKSLNPYICEISQKLFSLGTYGYDSIISAQTNMHDTIRALLWKMDPRSMIETLVGKLAESSTAVMIIGAGKTIALALLYRREAKKVINKKIPLVKVFNWFA